MYLQGRAATILSRASNWMQFEHYLPTNDRTYNYRSKNTTQIGELQFVYNLGSWPDYAAEMAGNPASDGAAIERLFEKRHLSFPHRAAHVRMFHSPSADHRSELMIIYGEALSQNSAIADVEFAASLPHCEVLHTRQKPSQDSHERSYAFTSIRATSRTSKNYSYLSAIIGSTRIARRAGI